MGPPYAPSPSLPAPFGAVLGLFVLAGIFLQAPQVAHGAGFFELELLDIGNPRGETKGGSCCGGAVRDSGTCPVQCQTKLLLCLKEYQNNVTSSGSCAFGNVTSPVLGGNSFSLSDPDDGKLVIPFVFRWTRSFTLILQALDHDNYSIPGKERIIEEASYSGIIVPSPEWHPLRYLGSVAWLSYRVRVRCDEHYFSSTCTEFCRPRNDSFGHYTCNRNGEKVCISGWTGINCEIAVCKNNCHPIHGKCDWPGDCECRPGWMGEFCDQCMPYPGCKHGYCNGSSWQCICETNWGGILCDQDLNYCGRHEPCQNGGTCENPAPDQYLCTCGEGFSGPNCEVVDNPCATQPCANGGTCTALTNGSGTLGILTANSFTCTCASGWAGDTCRINVDECASSPCLNGGSCVDLVNGYRCDCSAAWEGDTCQYDADECLLKPCVNSVSCTNTIGSYECRCEPGWDGPNCDQDIDDCVGQCQHGATCIDLVNDYHCACQPGYTGRDCHTDINDCESFPCLHGGECVDLVNDFRCICPVGYTGTLCELEHEYDHCNPNPCRNNAACSSTQSDYLCHCPEMWEGKNCDRPRYARPPSPCHTLPCDVTDNCLGGTVCGNHGRCVSVPGGGYKCVCEPGYTGKHCRENINDCKYNPCLNGGTCVDQVNAFRCICKEGWEGQTCATNRNDCEPNPCRNNGTCSDKLADFWCACRDGWKGKTCALRDSHCDRRTCHNGGSCKDLGDRFHCKCPPDWDGTTCHIRKNRACETNPCLNGGTCINSKSPEGFSCTCKDGFDGDRCQHDVDDCSPQPCLNGGRCVDGMNWFRCDCARGFAGPDCRININECASNPCAYGATCIDGIGQFQCLCPQGMKGLRCELVEELAFVSGVCLWKGQYLAHNSSWPDGCNICECNDSKVRCTRVWCGLENCLAHPVRILASPIATCGLNQVCVPVPREACLTPGCVSWGDCRALEAGKRVGPPRLPAPPDCWPNQAQLGAGCARLTLLLEHARLPSGASVEGLCRELRRLLAHSLAAENGPHREDSLVLLCELKSGYNDSIEVTISIQGSPAGVDSNRAVAEGVRILGELIGRKQTNLSALVAVVEVKVETALVSEERTGNGYVVALVCIILIILCALGLAVLLYWRQHRALSTAGLGSLGSLGAPGSIEPGNSRHHHDDEKSNNLQNEENLRRYANPLKEDGLTLGGSLANLRMSVCNPASACASAANLKMTTASFADLQNSRISVVRPLSASIGSLCHADGTSAEVLEMFTEKEHKRQLQASSSSSTSSSSSGSSSGYSSSPPPNKLRDLRELQDVCHLTYKAHTSDKRNNTTPALMHKDFNKQGMSLSSSQPNRTPSPVIPPSPVQRTFDSSLHTDRGGEVLTVLV